MSCHHTDHCHHDDGRLAGTWTYQVTNSGSRVVCRECGIPYGQVADPDSQSQMRKAYLEQQRRRACPGCGEEPFLG